MIRENLLPLTAIAILASFQLPAFGAESASDQGNVQAESSRSHNAFTGMTTTKVVRKAKRKIKTGHGSADAEDKIETTKKVSDDGKKASVKTEINHEENAR